ncbi:MAG: MotA/TolQ/ExbB proton channel family protein [Candidatus Nealsonbacteria bacterium]|nr:MotA/TolQ/ExbB proton channel family protein [Candidatus Nealsonbacteria bacterium]
MRLGKFSHLFLWLFFSGLFLVGMAGALVSGYWQKIPELDKTYISFLIILVFMIGWAFSLIDIIWITKLISSYRSADFEMIVARKEERSYFFSRTLVALGFMGTLVGILMVTISLGTLLSSEEEIAVIRVYIQGALGGMSTAFLTTIIGLVGSVFLELLHLIFKSTCLNLLSKWERHNEDSGQ